MLFKYTVLDKNGEETKGQIDAHSKDVAISSLQKRGFVIVEIKSKDDGGFLSKGISFGSGVNNKEIVILSKQLSTLFDAQVSALRIFRMIAGETKNEVLRDALTQIADDVADGSSVTKAMAKQPKIFSDFYVNMVAAGEESGKLSQTFIYLSNYLERSYELTSKVKGALIYPSFVVGVFIIVMYLMLTMVIPNIATMLTSSGKELPLPTKIVIGLSDFLVAYGFIFIIILVIGAYFLWQYIKSDEGKKAFDKFKTGLPLFGKLYKELYLARIAGNMNMMLTSGVAMVKSIENTSTVVGNKVYELLLSDIANDVRGGEAVSKAFAKHPNAFSSLLVQMIKVGEESGKLADILGTMSKFYEKEVLNTVANMVSLIEPIMITALGGGVGVLLSSVLLPIYSITTSV